MAGARKVIVSCAITGAIHTPTMSPYLPVTPAEIATSALGAAAAGASILHLHARDPANGCPTPRPEVFQQFLPQIHAGCDAVINITTGGGHNMSIDERLAAPLAARPELCSLNMGSMNFGLYPALGKFTEWKYEWEPRYLENTRAGIFRNTFADIEAIIRRLGDDGERGAGREPDARHQFLDHLAECRARLRHRDAHDRLGDAVPHEHHRLVLGGIEHLDRHQVAGGGGLRLRLVDGLGLAFRGLRLDRRGLCVAGQGLDGQRGGEADEQRPDRHQRCQPSNAAQRQWTNHHRDGIHEEGAAERSPHE